jgi:hypothetical protein
VGNHEAAELLVEAAIRLGRPQPLGTEDKMLGRVPLHHAARCNRHLAIKKMLAAARAQGGGADLHLDAQDADGRTPLRLACDHGGAEAARELLDAGADPAVLSLAGRSPLHAAVCGGHTEIARALLERLVLQGAAPGPLRDEAAKGLMHDAVESGDAELVRLLAQVRGAGSVI